MNANELFNEQQERTQVLLQLKESLEKRPWILGALTLYWTWVNMAFQSPLFFPASALEPHGMFPSWITPVAASALTYFVMGLRFRRTTGILRQRWYLYAVGLVMGVGALLSFIWIEAFGASLSEALPLALYLVGSIGVGAGTACLLLEWGRIFGYLGPREVLYHGIVAMLLSALLVCVLSPLPRLLAQLLFIAIPLPLIFCLQRALTRMPRKTLFEHGMSAILRTPHKFLITASLHGVALGVLLGSTILRAEETDTVFLNGLSFIVAALLLLLTALFVKMDFNHLIYQVGFSIMASGALLVALAPASPALGEFVQFIGFCYVHLIMWGLCSYLTKTFDLPAIWVVAWPTCCLMVGQLAGGAAAAILAQQPSPLEWIRTLATLTSFALLVSALLMMSNRNITTGWGIAQPATGHSDDGLDSALQLMVAAYRITPREADTLALLARGRNRRYISEELVISEETVKSHISNIYRKIGVHNQQELLDVIEVHVSKTRSAPPQTPFV